MSHSTPALNVVVPAQLAALSIYNPSLGATDETVHNQILYYYSREERERNEADRNDGPHRLNGSEEAENRKLRQIGLAQGMVDFAKNFSNGEPTDSVDTEKSRIIIHELERGWWILASIDLTRLPQPARAGAEPQVEYSAREVAPAQLLHQQLLRAQSIFLLHHASKLEELYQRVGRSTFASLLDKYWTAFASSWDVLLHGNPVVDICNGVKLAAGGELGVGVGEEEWGSGEREVLEDFVMRTEGLGDLIVSRFGDASETAESSATSIKTQSQKNNPPSPWLGTDTDPRSSDGVIFSGTGVLSRRSLATVSQWMEAIFKHGEDAYGVGENPSSRHRRKRARLARKKGSTEDPPVLKLAEGHTPNKSRDVGEPDLRREAMERNAISPGIPPSLVPIVDRSLDKDVCKSDEDGKPASKLKSTSSATDQESSLFDTDKMMGYLKLGYGSSWTLSPKGLPGNKVEEWRASSNEPDGEKKSPGSGKNVSLRPEAPPLQEVDPTPEISETDEHQFVQRLEQSIGKFIIGLSGDLENTEFDEDGQDEVREEQQSNSQRLFLRTLTVEMGKSRMVPQRHSKAHDPGDNTSTSNYSQDHEPPTSASASVDGAQSIISHQKVQVAVYVHQPFIFVFLFQLHTPSLTMPSFYRNIHHQLGPLQKPLLASTDLAKIALRIADTMGESRTTTSPATDGATGPTIYDIIYDPLSLTVRTSIPNIPLPGSLAAEGLSTASSSLTISGSWYTLGIPIGSTTPAPSRKPTSVLVQSHWTRVEALNVYMQMLNTWVATRNAAEIERTVKTGRGWWILWMQIPDDSYNQPKKEAFLVRRAVDHKLVAGGNTQNNVSGMWLLGEQSREVSGASNASTQDRGTSSAGVSEGVGVDARRWVEGLLRLSR